jgi:hypothetical protein
MLNSIEMNSKFFYLKHGLMIKIATLFIFMFCGIIATLNHEVWFDEAHHFLVGRDSQTLTDLIRICSNDSHPYLWNFLVWMICKFSTNILAVQFLNFSFSVFSALLILWKSPFKFYQNFLLIFSYFLFYEYGIISRNYSISVLMIIIITNYISKPNPNLMLAFLLLGILANTHFFSFLYSFCISIFLVFTYFKDKQENTFNDLIAGIAVYFLLILLLIVQIKNSSGHVVFGLEEYSVMDKISKSFSITLKGLFHFQDLFSIHRWNSNIFINHSKLLSIFLGLLAWIIPFFIFKKSIPFLLLTYSYFFLIALFTYFFPYIVALRHCGFLFVVLIANYWIYNSRFKEENNSYQLSETIFNCLLVLNFAAFIVIIIHDFRYDFSGGKKAAQFISSYTKNKNYTVVGDNTSIAVYCTYAGKKALIANNFKESSFCKWNQKPFEIEDKILIEKIKNFKKNNTQRLILIRQKALDLNLLKEEPGIHFLKSFTNNIVTSENYFVYEL